jgi:hypothetical protein
MHVSASVVCTILSLGAILSTPAETSRFVEPRDSARPFSAAQGTRVEISDPGKTGLTPGWHMIELKEGIDQDKAEITLILSLAPSGKHHRYPARTSGCARSDVKVLSWKPSVTRRRDGSLQLELVATSARGCKVVATIPAIPGIEGSPVGTAGAPGKKAPTIEGSPVGTAGAPPKPGASGRRTFDADAEFERLIVKARQALPQLSCAGAPRNVQARLAPLQSALQDVANASSAAAAVQPLRRFEAARTALQKSLAAGSGTAAGADRCANAERRCAASGSVASACGIDAGVCLAGIVCSAER